MSKYTTEVRYICEKAAGYDESKGYADVDEIINDSISDIFSFDFPIFDESYRNVICTKILKHYYTREIGFETVGLWKLKLDTKLNEIMPFYNQLYKSELLKFNPLYDVDLQTTHIGSKDGETIKQENRSENAFVENDKTGETASDSANSVFSKGKNSETGDSTKNNVNANNESGVNYDLYSDTPQGALNGVENETYLTNARKVTDSRKKDGVEVGNEKYNRNDEAENNEFGQANTKGNYNEQDKHSRNVFGNVNGSDKFNSTENYVLHVVGKQAGQTYSKMLKEFRTTFLNIDVEVINELKDLFLNLW